MTIKFIRALLLASLLLPALAQAQLFKCKDATGKTTYQEVPCADKTVQKKMTKDTPADGVGNDGVKPSGRTASGTDGDKRLPVDRAPSQATIDSCVKYRRADMAEEMADFKVSGNLTKRIWTTPAGTAERMLVNVTVRETKQLSPKRATFTCVLTGDDGVDAAATARLDAEK